jgi:mevalonate kinase
MDVAVIATGKPVRFLRGELPKVIRITRLPRFTFHDTGLRSQTLECVKKVQSLGQSSPEVGAEIDRRMARSSLQIADALQLYDHDRSGRAIKQIAEGMYLAQKCFEDWGLVPDSVKGLIAELQSQGALAAKLTGAGAGGMVVALWND